jgi:hypothetical protein
MGRKRNASLLTKKPWNQSFAAAGRVRSGKTALTAWLRQKPPGA